MILAKFFKFFKFWNFIIFCQIKFLHFLSNLEISSFLVKVRNFIIFGMKILHFLSNFENSSFSVKFLNFFIFCQILKFHHFWLNFMFLCLFASFIWQILGKIYSGRIVSSLCVLFYQSLKFHFQPNFEISSFMVKIWNFFIFSQILKFHH